MPIFSLPFLIGPGIIFFIPFLLILLLLLPVALIVSATGVDVPAIITGIIDWVVGTGVLESLEESGILEWLAGLMANLNM